MNKVNIESQLISLCFNKSIHPMHDGNKGCSLFFDSASIGLKGSHVENHIVDGDWKSTVNFAKDSFARVINSSNSHISLFHNTTSAVQRVLTQLNNYSPFQGSTLVTTDVEYPGIYAASNEIWEGPICVIQVSDLIYNCNSINEDKIFERISTAIKLVKPTVLYFSHITRSQGYVFDIDRISKFADQVLPYKFLIVDGAQSIGNIHVDIEKLPLIDAYVTSGHKWLCGPQHIGILYSDPKWRLEDPAQSYSETVKSSGTGNRDVISKFSIALQYFVKDGKSFTKEIGGFNNSLANYFAVNLGNAFEIIGGKNYSKRSGIVVFRPKQKNLKMEEVGEIQNAKKQSKKNRKSYSFAHLHPEEVPFLPWSSIRLRYILKEIKSFKHCHFTPEKIDSGLFIQHTGQWFRACFHFYHDKNAVINLIRGLNQALKKELK